MLDLIKKNLPLALGALVIVLALVVYLNFFAGNSTALLASTADAGSPLSQDLLVTLSNLHTIKLDNSIFTDPLFESLTSFGVQIPPENVGRRNPFLPIGAQ
ncbi:MAG TPA: hypothetical protein VN701_02420 [Candidatus Paceibacterota bacterium]|nr:hypothetical protein [Candidatus Paceibacterota bacterium]